MKKKIEKNLLIAARPFSGKSDGPHQILTNLVDSTSLKNTDVFYGGEAMSLSEYLALYAPAHSFAPIVNFKLIRHLLQHGPAYGKITIFGSFRAQYIILTTLLVNTSKVTVIGYDSLTRTSLLNLKASNFIKKIPSALRLIKFFLIELYITVMNVRVLFVSDYCLEFHKKMFQIFSPKIEKLHTLPNVELCSVKRVTADKVVIVGPCISDLDYSNFREVISLLRRNGFVDCDFILVGLGFEQIKESGSSKIKFIKSFDNWALECKHPIVSLRQRAPGVQTKVQRLLLFGNVVFAADIVDVSPISNSCIRNLAELKRGSTYESVKIDNNKLKKEIFEDACLLLQ